MNLEQRSQNYVPVRQVEGPRLPHPAGFGQIIDDLEEAQMVHADFAEMRHVTPFREPVQEQLTALSDTADTLELWIKVQLLWTALGVGLHGHGDIRQRQMPHGS